MKSRWGPWVFHANTWTLEYIHNGWWYEVDLFRCKTSAEILDWLCQIHEKPWTSLEDIGHLLAALNDLSDGLQSKVCSGGLEIGPIKWEELVYKTA